MVRFLVGFVVVVGLLIVASTIEQYQKTRGQTAEQKTEYSRYINGRNLRCDQLQAAADRARDQRFYYPACMNNR